MALCTFAFPLLLAENEKCVHYNLMGGTVLHWLGFCKAAAGKENNFGKSLNLEIIKQNKELVIFSVYLILQDLSRIISEG